LKKEHGVPLLFGAVALPWIAMVSALVRGSGNALAAAFVLGAAFLLPMLVTQWRHPYVFPDQPAYQRAALLFAGACALVVLTIAFARGYGRLRRAPAAAVPALVVLAVLGLGGYAFGAARASTFVDLQPTVSDLYVATARLGVDERTLFLTVTREARWPAGYMPTRAWRVDLETGEHETLADPGHFADPMPFLFSSFDPVARIVLVEGEHGGKRVIDVGGAARGEREDARAHTPVVLPDGRRTWLLPREDGTVSVERDDGAGGFERVAHASGPLLPVPGWGWVTPPGQPLGRALDAASGTWHSVPDARPRHVLAGRVLSASETDAWTVVDLVTGEAAPARGATSSTDVRGVVDARHVLVHDADGVALWDPRSGTRLPLELRGPPIVPEETVTVLRLSSPGRVVVGGARKDRGRTDAARWGVLDVESRTLTLWAPVARGHPFALTDDGTLYVVEGRRVVALGPAANERRLVWPR
jgi:hypothetical protein